MNRDEIMQAMSDLAGAGETRSLNEDERSKYAELEKALVALNETDEIRARQTAWNTTVTARPSAPAADNSDEVRSFTSYLRTGVLPTEQRALQVGTDASGGYLAPDVVSTQIVQRKESFGGFLNEVTKINTNSGAKMTWPTLEPASADDAGITAESALFTHGSDMVFGSADLDTYKITTAGANDLPLRISVELLDDAGVDVIGLVSSHFGERIARKEAQFALTGTGSGQPKGILNGTPDLALASGNAFTYAKLLEAEGHLDPAYRGNAKWLFSTSAWAGVRGMVDDNGRPLVTSSTDGIGGGMALSLLGYPVILDSSAPAASGDNVNFAAFGDFREAYVARTVNGLHVVTDPYTRMNYGEVQMVAWERWGGTVKNRAAYVLVATYDAA